MNNKTLELWVGLFMLAGIAALGVLALKVGNMGGSNSNSYQVEARFENIGGLNIKAPVTIGGVRIGRVSDITLDPDEFSAVVTLDIAQNYELPMDTSAAILTSGLLGAQFVGLQPGGDDEMLADGDEIELTQSTIQLEDIIGQFIFNSSNSPKEDGNNE